MLCGHLKQSCKSITVGDLINILQSCKNKDALVKFSNTTNFYIHFDMDGQFVDFSKQARGSDYGENGVDNKCEGCHSYSKEEKTCKCNGNDCLNVDSIVDTKIWKHCSSCKQCSSKDSKNVASTTELKIGDVVKTIPPVLTIDKRKETEISFEDYIQELIDKALINTLTRMIDSIK